MFGRQECFGCKKEIHCKCMRGGAKYCPIHTPSRYGELCSACYMGVLATAGGLTVGAK